MIKKSKITAAVMAAILAVTTIFSPVLAGEFSSPEEITEEFSDGQENQDYKNEISDDMPQIQNEDGEGVSATESEKEKIVKTDEEFKSATDDSSVDIIIIRGYIGNHENNIDQLPDGKKIIIDSGYKFKITSSSHSRVYTTNIEICDKAELIIDSKNQDGQIWLKGIIKNKGNINVAGSGNVYVNYQENLGTIYDKNNKLKINILKDGEEEIKVSIPSKVTAGDTITPIITGMIPGSKNKASEIFKVKWESNDDSLTEETGISYKVPVDKGKSNIKLKLILNEQYGAVKQNDVQNPDNFKVQKRAFQSNECTIEKKTLDTIYVDNNNGDDQNTGEKATPVKTFLRALRGIENGGTIILLSNCVTNAANFDKTVTVTGKSNGSSLTSTRCFIDSNITVTLNNISIETDDISLYKHSGKSGEPGKPGNLVLNAVNANIKK